MKKILSLFAILILFTACEDGDFNMNRIKSEFKLYDNNGIEKNIFQSGDDFEMRFELTNNSGKDLIYYYTGVPVIFEIHQNDSIIATSVDGYVFPEVVLSDTIKNNETYHFNLIAPNTPVRATKIILQAGNYQAYVKHSAFFVDFRYKETLPIPFTIIE